MEIDVQEAERDERPVLERLFQLYQYDFSEIMGGETDDDGLFHDVNTDDHWDDSAAHLYLLRVDGKLAGAASVIERSHFTDDPSVTCMDEFFVMRKYRRRGIGTEFARRLFDLFPGRWEVAEVAPNADALAFWRSVISEYMNGNYEERFEDSERWQGPVQSFQTLAAVRTEGNA